jgi:hypothetical protein
MFLGMVSRARFAKGQTKADLAVIFLARYYSYVDLTVNGTRGSLA